MENASKALMMAGGVLIGVLVIAVLVFAYSQMQNLPLSEEEQLAAEQLAAFNLEYESYNKDVMYGTDVISVLNKAISNNKKYADNSNYIINISFTIKNEDSANIGETVVTYKSTDNGATFSKTKSVTTTLFSKGRTYSLADNYDNNYRSGDSIVESNKINHLLSKTDTEIRDPIKANTYNKDGSGNYWYTITYSAFSDFKRSIFRCKEVKYNNEGRINDMHFVQTAISTY